MSTNNTAPAKGNPIRSQNGPDRSKKGQDYKTGDATPAKATGKAGGSSKSDGPY